MDELKLAWELYLENTDEAMLLDEIEKHSISLPGDVDYPYAHRICDIKISDQYFRVVRLADKQETVYIYKCETPSLNTPGVPYWLKGDMLQKWVNQVAEAQMDEDYDEEASTDWELFR